MTDKIRILKPIVEWEQDIDPPVEYLKQRGFKEQRKRYENDEYYYQGVKAKVTVVVDGLMIFFESGGLWGIESDSDPAYKETLEQEQMDDLKDTLGTLAKHFPKAFAKTKVFD